MKSAKEKNRSKQGACGSWGGWSSRQGGQSRPQWEGDMWGKAWESEGDLWLSRGRITKAEHMIRQRLCGGSWESNKETTWAEAEWMKACQPLEGFGLSCEQPECSFSIVSKGKTRSDLHFDKIPVALVLRILCAGGEGKPGETCKEGVEEIQVRWHGSVQGAVVEGLRSAILAVFWK